jgi:hypothetical protein
VVNHIEGGVGQGGNDNARDEGSVLSHLQYPDRSQEEEEVD